MLASSPLNSSPTLGLTAPPTTGGNSNNSTAANAGSSTKYLTKSDREALLQYTKHFVRKAVQIVVQSRLGDKKPTKSRVYAYNADWFNLSVKDLAQITTMTKASLGQVEALFNSTSPFCVEISLRTPENQTMILETWCILFNEQLVDTTQKICYSVYKKMSLVLRSLICITRCIPTYQLSRRQNSDTYVLLYRMYSGEPIVHHLGENYGTAKVGTVGTPIGSIIVNVAYRTRLTMTPQNSSNHFSSEYSGGIQIKDDHFIPEHVEQRKLSSGGSNRYSPNDLVMASEFSNSPGSPQLSEKSPRLAFDQQHHQPQQQQQHQSSSSSSSLSKRSSSNLNTIAEVTTNAMTKTRVSSKTQPIPMKSSVSQQAISSTKNTTTGSDLVATSAAAAVNTTAAHVNTPKTGSGNKNYQLQRLSTNESQQLNEESSADEYGSSVSSTPDTIYYFKLKSAAFVPSTSYTNNFYSSSVGNLASAANESEIPPFIALLSNDFSNLSTMDRQQLAIQNEQQSSQMTNMAQSPPPPNNLIDFNMQQRQRQAVGGGGGKLRNSMTTLDERLASPCSLPNFKMLDNNQFLNYNPLLNANSNNNNNQNVAAGAEPDDFVFIESKKIAFGLSNAADDLRNFFRACENAPMLDSFQNEPIFNDILKDLDQQLLSYESKVAEFDELIKSLENN